MTAGMQVLLRLWWGSGIAFHLWSLNPIESTQIVNFLHVSKRVDFPLPSRSDLMGYR